MSVIFTFKPKQVTNKLLSPLNERSKDIIAARFGLGERPEKKTLEAIGNKYGITRERVRQIENVALNNIRNSSVMKDIQSFFENLKGYINELGILISEKELLEELSKDVTLQNHYHFYLILGDQFIKHEENESFKDRWSVDQKISEIIHKALDDLHDEIDGKENVLFSEKEIFSKILEKINLSNEFKKENYAKRWINVSKIIAQNPLGEWGWADSPLVSLKNIRNYLFLVMRNHNSPMHFREIAEKLSNLLKKKVNIATCHNELIKNDEFVLIGRGIYALKEWGYEPGTTIDIIRSILKKNKKLTKEEIIEKVLKERYVKKGTILINLQNKKYFKVDKNGYYSLV